ncbi:MAG: hypothetical protein M5U22_08815 [Thermoleophilia bacterium]|nr:hypothetical protein [Thermoleophilia bacterium]
MNALRRHLVVWAPLFVWLGVIAVTSTELGARSSVDVWYWRLLHEWLPQIFGREPSGLTPSSCRPGRAKRLTSPNTPCSLC